MQLTFTDFTKFFLVIFSIFTFIGQTNAQEKFNKGTIILSSGQHVEGMIQDNDLSIFSRLIAFKESKKLDEVEIYNPDQIKGFITQNGQKYEAATVDFALQTKGGLVHNYTGQRFLRVLNEGTIRIYELRDIDAKAWFIKKEGEPVELLTLNKKLNDAEVQLMLNKIADCGCIFYDESLTTKIGDVVATVIEYNEFNNSPVYDASAALETEETENVGLEMP